MLKMLDRLEEMADRRPDGRGDAADLRRGHASLRRRAADSRSCRTALLTLNLSWAQELCIYMFVWMAKFGAAYGVRTGIHVGVDVLINRLPDRTRAGRTCCSACSPGALFTGVVGTLGAHFVWEIAHTDQVSADLEVPMWIVYLCIPLGSYLMCFRFLQVAWAFAKHRRAAAPRRRGTSKGSRP